MFMTGDEMHLKAVHQVLLDSTLSKRQKYPSYIFKLSKTAVSVESSNRNETIP